MGTVYPQRWKPRSPREHESIPFFDGTALALIHNMHLLTRALPFALVLALAGCSSTTGSVDLASEPAGLGDQVTQGKADGAFGSTEIEIGDTVSGETAGDGIVLYALEIADNDEITVVIRRTSGDLRPAAYLYRGTETFVRPELFDVTPSRVELDFIIASGGQHHIVVKAHDGVGAGGFEMEVRCNRGPCEGGSGLTGVARQAECINDGARCAIARLPDYNGRVGEVTARNVFGECLVEQGSDCSDACDGDAEPYCADIIGQLPWLADQTVECHSALTTCLGGCEEIGGYYGSDTIEESAAAACWDGYNGNCLEYTYAHADCGGEHAAGSVGECRAYCAGTEGAWDEGPWDGCMDQCYALQSGINQFIEEVADSVGEFFDETDHDALVAVSYDDVPADVMDTVRRRIESDNEDIARDPERAARGDRHELADVAPHAIVEDGARVGYQVSVDFYYDAPLFDGAGEHLWLNLDGEIITETGWEG